MAIRVALHHNTHYRFDRPVNLSPHEIRLRPAGHCRTPIHSYSLKVRPADHFINWQQDPYGNYVARLVFPKPTTELELRVDLVAEMTVINPFDFFVESYAENYPFAYPTPLVKELAPFFEIEPCGPLLQGWLERFRHSQLQHPIQITDFLVSLNQHVQRDIEYIVRLEPGIQTCEETLGAGRGSCRDTAWLVVQILRNLGLAARFVSGYLIQLVADIKPLDGPVGPPQDFTDLHAWAEVYIPGAGWVGLDATSGLLAGEGHIPLTCTAIPASSAPVTGSTDPCESQFDFTMSITRVHEDPRVTKPFTDWQWQEIMALGEKVDAELKAGDVRLTMGGEPTFVSVDDMDGKEWNFTVLSPAKRQLAGDLIKRLKTRFTQGALLHYGQGKWYPGESLPRWALNCYWRADGKPVWHDATLLADDAMNYGYHVNNAERFVSVLAQRLGVDPAFIIPAYEDPCHYGMEMNQLPINIDLFQKDLKDTQQRSTLARIADAEQRLKETVGYVLPLKVKRVRKSLNPVTWLSSPWPLRREHLFLLPGESPMGLRIPLKSLPWVAPEDKEIDHERDPLEAREPLTDLSCDQDSDRTSNPEQKKKASKSVKHEPSAKEIVRTALCVEPRQGRLYLFMPPCHTWKITWRW